MAKKLHLEFPEAKGRYWYLHWIGETCFEDKTFKVILFFVNKLKPDLNVRDFTNSTFDLKINASSLIYYNVGTIYDSLESELVLTKEIDKENTLLKRDFNKVTVKMNDNFHPTKNKFPLVGNPQFPDVAGLDQEEITFMKYQNKYNNDNGSATVYSVLVTSYCLLEYFFFRSSRIINKILSGQALIAFKFNQLKIVSDPKENMKIALLPYDNTVISKKDATRIAPFLFLKNKLGVKMLESLYSSLYKNLKKNQKKGSGQISGYIDLFFATGNYELKVAGTPFNDHNYEKEDKLEIRKIFFASKVIWFKFLTDDIFEVDKVILVPLFPNKSKDKDQKDEDSVPDNTDQEYDISTLNLYTHKPAAGGKSTKDDQLKTDQVSPFSLNVKIDTFSGDKKKIRRILFEKEFDGVSTEDNNNNLFEDLMLLQQDAEKQYYKTILLDNLEYFSKVVAELKNLQKVKNISINDDPLCIGRSYYPYEMSTRLNRYLVDIVEIMDGNLYLYAVEFGHGMIGIFKGRNSEKLNSSQLLLSLKEFIEKDKDQPKKGSATTGSKENGVLLWTIIHNKFKDDFLQDGIEVQRAVKHERKDESTTINAFRKTADKILTRRIKDH